MESQQTFESLNELIFKYTNQYNLIAYAPKISKNEFINTIHYLQSDKYINDYNLFYAQINDLIKTLNNQTGKLVFESEIKEDLEQIENSLQEYSCFMPTDVPEAIKIDNLLRDLDFTDSNNIYKKDEIIYIGHALIARRLAYNCRKLRTLYLSELESRNNEILYDGNERFLIDVAIIIKSHKKLNNEFFNEMTVSDYLTLFNLNNPNPKNLAFKPRQQTNFVYFLKQLENDAVEKLINQKIAFERFGIKNYDQLKSDLKCKPSDRAKLLVYSIFNKVKVN